MGWKSLSVFCLAFFTNFMGNAQTARSLSKDSIFIGVVLRQHNIYREVLQLPSLVWSSNLAADAQAWADHLADINKGQHDLDIRGKEGENIFWGTAGAYSFSDMVSFWGNEKKFFVYGVFPDCKASGSAVVGHYTQIVWKNTRSVGCAVGRNGKMDYLVCRYAAPGNIVGEKPY